MIVKTQQSLLQGKTSETKELVQFVEVDLSVACRKPKRWSLIDIRMSSLASIAMLILCITLVLSTSNFLSRNPSPPLQEKENPQVLFEAEIFQLEVLGHDGTPKLIPLAEPPNYTGPPGDTLGYKQVAFRLIYNGSTPCNITKLKLWQETKETGTNMITNVFMITPPTSLLSHGDQYDFLVDLSGSTDWLMLAGIFWLHIETENLGEFLVSSSSTGVNQKLITWPLSSISSINSSSSTITPAFLWLITPLTGFFVIRWRKTRTKK